MERRLFSSVRRVIPARAIGQSFRTLLAVTTAGILVGCFHHPKLDVESLPCTSDENCPVGSTCDPQKGKCSLSGSSPFDGGGIDGIGGSSFEAGSDEVLLPIDGLMPADARSAIDGTSAIDGPVVEAGRIDTDAPGTSSYDAGSARSADSLADIPATDSPAGVGGTGAGGEISGNGGVPGTGPTAGAGGTSGTAGTRGTTSTTGGAPGVGGAYAIDDGGVGGLGSGGTAEGGKPSNGGAGPGGVGAGGASIAGSGGWSATGGVSGFPDAAATGGGSGSGGSVVGSGGTGAGGATGTPPDLESSTATLDLGDAPMGESSGEGTFTLTNLGQQTSGPIHLASTSPDFVLGGTGDNTCISDTTTLAQNASCTVRVVLTPASTGAKSAFITFQSNPGNSGHVSVSGTATPGALLSGGTTTALSFPLGTVGIADPPTSLTVTNVGPRSTGAISVTSDNPDFSVQTGSVGDCGGAELAPNGTCTVRVVLTPSISGSLTAKISISASPGGVVSVTASGSACPVLAHDDGTGSCLPADSCAAGLHNSGTGRCVPNQTCPANQRTDDSGNCVPVAGINWVYGNIQAKAVALSADGKKLVAVGTQHVYTSTNWGQDWSERLLPASEDWRGVTSSTDGATLVVLGTSGVYASTDSGANWALQQPQAPTPLPRSLSGASADGKIVAGSSLLVPGGGCSSSDALLSRDMGTTWNQMEPASSCAVIALSADGSHIYWVAGTTGFHASGDSGASWSDTTTELPDHSVVCSADGAKVALLSAMGSYLSTDYGSSWTSGWPVNMGKLLAGSAGLNVLIAGDSSPSISTNYGQNWTVRYSSPANALAVSACGNTVVVIDSTTSAVYTSTGPVP